MAGANEMRSLNGWLASSDPDAIGIKSYSIQGSKVKIRCAEKVAPLLVAFCQDFNRLIEPIDEGKDDWGYCFRMVRGTANRLSNHSSGTAIDLNALKHPLGKIGTFPAEIVPMLRALATKYGLKWGGDYRGRRDEMHFEINVSEAKAKELIERLGLKA